MSRRVVRAILLLEATGLGALLGALLHLWAAPTWIAVLCAAACVALAVALVLLARPRRVSGLVKRASAARALVDPQPSAGDPAPARTAPAAPPRASAAGAPAHRAAQLRALGYARVAREANVRELEAYSQTIRAWCVECELTLMTVVHDVEVQPGDRGATPALSWALEQIAGGEVETLVVARLRHLSNSVANLPPLLRWFTEPQRRLVAIDFGLDTATEAGRLAAFALAGVGGWEHERLSAKTRQGLEAARSGGAGRGRASVDDVPELRERILRMREQGLTLQAIADALNEEGVPTLRGGARWRPSSVQRAAGYRRPPGKRGMALPSADSGSGGELGPASGAADKPD